MTGIDRDEAFPKTRSELRRLADEARAAAPADDDGGVLAAAVAKGMAEASRLGAAAAMRMQATSLRSLADLYAQQARLMDSFANDVESGVVPLPACPVRLVVAPLDNDEPVDGGEVEPDAVQATEARMVGNAHVLTGFDGGELSAPMIAWLDEFDDRVKMSRHFVQAVNEAAASGLAANMDTAELVAERVRELAAARNEAESDG